MFTTKKDKQKELKYKATYKSLHSGDTKVFAVAEPTEELTNFLQKGEDIWEMYMLVSVERIKD